MNRSPLPGILAVLLLVLLAPLFWLANGIVALDDWLQARTGRDAADPDKETPPGGWRVTGTSASGKSVATHPVKPGVLVLGSKPAFAICPVCERDIHDDDTIAECHGIVWHARCWPGRYADHG